MGPPSRDPPGQKREGSWIPPQAAATWPCRIPPPPASCEGEEEGHLASVRERREGSLAGAREIREQEAAMSEGEGNEGGGCVSGERGREE